MSAKVYVATMDAEGLTVLIAALRPQVPFAILERPDQVGFPGESETIAAADWPVGRVFGKKVELYWEQEDSAYQTRLTYAGEATPPPEFREMLSLDVPEPEAIWYYLWGEDEVAIGGRLDYSRVIPGRGRGRLGVVEYRDEAGRLVFYRYAGLRREVEHGR